eukprot:COSAG01_NODE_22638_length_847_cov_1.725936_1_plen_91_part_10
MTCLVYFLEFCKLQISNNAGHHFAPEEVSGSGSLLCGLMLVSSHSFVLLVALSCAISGPAGIALPSSSSSVSDSFPASPRLCNRKVMKNHI